jgi:ESF2/ABP1 family protein
MSDEESQQEERILGQKKGKLLKEAEQYKESLEKRGVIYMSRVPPFMKPNKARNLFEQYGEVTRIFLQEEGKCTTRQFCLDDLYKAWFLQQIVW